MHASPPPPFLLHTCHMPCWMHAFPHFSVLPQLSHCSQAVNTCKSQLAACAHSWLPEPYKACLSSPHCMHSTSPSQGLHCTCPTPDSAHLVGLQPDADSTIFPACAICLGHFSHRVIKCNTSTIWVLPNHCQTCLRQTVAMPRQPTPLH